MKKQRRVKIIAACVILVGAMTFLVVTGIKSTSMRQFTPATLMTDRDFMHNQRVQVDGFIAEETPEWDAANFKLTFAIRDPESTATVNVIYKDRLKPDNFTEGGSVSVEGRYDAQRNLIVATKLMTKCASKYEGAESAASAEETSYVSE